MPDCIALIVAAGRGTRAATGKSRPKQYRLLAGQAVLRRTVESFLNHPAIDGVRVVFTEEDRALYDSAVAGLDLMPPVQGGKTRRESVLRGLESLAAEEPPRFVLIHDAARPLVGARTIAAVRTALDHHAGAVPALAIPDTIKDVKAGHVRGTVSRDHLWRAQTPQGFRFADILAAHRTAASEMDAERFTDDAMIAEAEGLDVVTVPGDEDNMKITTDADFTRAERILLGELPDVRTGQGFDVHGFGPPGAGGSIMLCGVAIPHPRPVIGHSDSDVGLHALTDAILGAIGDGDIGSHFPPSDERWRGASSHIFLAHAAELVAKRGGRIVHCDVTILCEEPRVSPHRETMRTRIAEILALPVDRVSVKATTTERLGFLGRAEGIGAQALATVRLPAGA